MSLSTPFPFPQISAPPSPRPRGKSIRKRMWQTVIALGAIWILLIGQDIRERLNDPSPKLSLGHDLLPSYAAGLLARQGRPRDMYDRQAISEVEFRIIEQAQLNIDGRYGPWLNPPFYAWAFAPLSMLPYRQAAAVFLAFNLIAFAISLGLLWRIMWHGRPARVFSAETSASRLAHQNHHNPRTILLALLLVLLPLPLWQVMGHQQNTFISLLLLTLGIFYWHRGNGFVAGLVAGLLFFKPQLAVAFAGILVVGMGWRALAGLAVTGTALLLVTLLTMPGCLSDFLHRLPPILHWLQVELPYNWGRQVTFHSFWRLIIQGQVRGETILSVKIFAWSCSAALGIFLAAAAWKFFKHRGDSVARDRLIAAAIVSMPLLMPYYMDYDLLLLIIPAALLAREWMAHPDTMTTADRRLAYLWLGYCLESHFNPGLASEFHAGKWVVNHLAGVVHLNHIAQIHLNLAVPILLGLSLLHICRCFRRTAVPAIFDARPISG
ncbi:MAG TPA: glycosyltransferase family 87 protein [Tepidisphaeraceae bacterium]|jgi:hypothetical protein|nr:glycosyltransferase family 87 protein [Tepidisphaeraceae bacterium]